MQTDIKKEAAICLITASFSVVPSDERI